MMEIKNRKGDCELCQVARGGNEEVDSLVKMVATGEKHLIQPVPFEVLYTPATEEKETLPIEVVDT